MGGELCELHCCRRVVRMSTKLIIPRRFVCDYRWSSRKRRTSMSDTSDSRSDTMDDCMAAMVLMRLSVSPKSPRLSGSDSGKLNRPRLLHDFQLLCATSTFTFVCAVSIILYTDND